LPKIADVIRSNPQPAARLGRLGRLGEWGMGNFNEEGNKIHYIGLVINNG